MVELLRDVVHHVILRGFMSHGLAQLACHQRFGHGFLAMLPEEQCHLLPLHQHCPHHQLMEGEREVVDFRVVQINVHLLLFFPRCLLPPSSDWHVILSRQGILDSIVFNTLEFKGHTRIQIMFRLISEEVLMSNQLQNQLHSETELG